MASTLAMTYTDGDRIPIEEKEEATKRLEELLEKEEQQLFIDGNKIAYLQNNDGDLYHASEVANWHLTQDNEYLRGLNEHLMEQIQLGESNMTWLKTMLYNCQQSNAELATEVANLRELLTDSHQREREMKKQFDQPTRNGPNRDPIYNDKNEVHAYLVTPKTQDKSKDIRNRGMAISEVYHRCVPPNGTQPELTSFMTTCSHWKLATADGSRRFGNGYTPNDMIARKIAMNIKPGCEHLFEKENWKTAPENNEHENTFNNYDTGYAFPFQINEEVEMDLTLSRSIWEQILEMIDSGVPEEEIIVMCEKGHRKFDPIAKIQYLHNL